MGGRGWIVLVLCCLLAGFVLAENDSGLNASFGLLTAGLPEGIIPPSIPNAGAAKSNIGQPGNVLIAMQDVNTKEFLSNVHVNYEVISNEERFSSLQYVGEIGLLELNLDPGTYNIMLRIDKPDTNGYDYYASETFMIDEKLNKTLTAFPIGSVRGTVSSSRGTLVSGAVLKFECSKQYGDFSQQTTDSFGSFKSNYLPTGMCVITASSNGLVGSETIDLAQGELKTLDIVLKSAVTGTLVMSWILWLIVIAVVAAFITAFFILHRRKASKKVSKTQVTKKTRKETKEKTKKQKSSEKMPIAAQSAGVNKRAQDIIKTLNPREKEIVNFLLDCKDPCLQNRIIHHTGIPKTSIVRIFENLQSKNIIEVKKLGKAKKVGLTPWFLEKE
jgi:uncharacterized membrane protein